MHRHLFITGRTTVRLISTKTQQNLNVANVAAVAEDQKELAEAKSNSKPDSWDSARPYSEIPGPKPLPLIGNTWRFLPLIGDFHGLGILDYTERLKTYGDVAIMRNVLGKDMVFAFNPDDLETIYRNEGQWPIRTTLETLEYYRQHIRRDVFRGLTSMADANGKEWQELRSIANPILSQIRSVQLYIPEMDRVAEDFKEKMRYFISYKKEGEMPEDFMNELCKWSLESIGFVALDKRLGCLANNLKPDSETQKVINAVNNFFSMMYDMEFTPSLWKLYSTRKWKEYVKTLNIITDTFHKYITEAKELYEKDKNVSGNNKSMLQRFLDVNEVFAITMSMDLLTAGVDTTSRSSASILYQLSRHQRAQDELRKELMELLPTKDTPITKEVLNNASYLKATVKEGQRIAGVIFSNVRTATKDMVVGGYQIPKGTIVNMSNFGSMHSEKQYPRPEEFLPERWLRSNTGELSHKNAHPFTFLPFGFGPRSCIGKQLALMEMEVIIAKIIRNFKMEWPHPPAKYVAKLFYTIDDPLKFKVTELEK